MLKPRSWALHLALLALLLAPAAAVAGDRYFECPVSALPENKEHAGKAATDEDDRSLWRSARFAEWVAVQGAGEAFIAPQDLAAQPQAWRWGGAQSFYCRVEEGGALSGTTYDLDPRQRLLVRDFKVGEPYLIEIDAARFFRAKAAHYELLFEQRLPGAAWYRHQASAARALLPAEPAVAPQDRGPQFEFQAWGGRDDLYDAYDLFSGGHALSENIQLERRFTTDPASESAPGIDIGTLSGITVREFDWTPHIAGKTPALDPLAATIPGDQHAVFFRTFGDFTTLVDELDRIGSPLLHSIEESSEDARSKERYERQLCLSMSALARLLGDKLVASVALTGSDPYVRTGTDVALLFEPKSREILEGYLAARHQESLAAGAGCRPVTGEIEGVQYSGVATPDRIICSYRATLPQAVVVTNSLAQLRRLIATSKARESSLAASPEYTFFRDRYVFGDPRETALLVVTDATLRRWCGPRWRIADARRTRAAAWLLDLQCQSAATLATGAAVESPLAAPADAPPDLGALTLTAAGAHSATYGTAQFLTPILELAMDKITDDERAGYERFRESYQAQWRAFFDPIAVRFGVGPGRLALDTSVYPLIAGSEYRRIIEFSGDSKIGAEAGDRHVGTLLHLATAIDPKSSLLKDGAGFILRGGGAAASAADPRNWFGPSVALYLESDPEWLKRIGALDGGRGQVNEGKMFAELANTPIVLAVESRDAMLTALFITTARGLIEQSAPGLLDWDPLEHNGQSYVRVRARQGGGGFLPPGIAVYYCAAPEVLFVALREDLLKKALDRRAARVVAKGDGAAQDPPKPAPAPGTTAVTPATPGHPTEHPWLGQSFCVQLDRAFLDFMKSLDQAFDVSSTLRHESWRNLPILNEWKRRFPEQDPVVVHERVLGVRPVCAAGGAYVWDAKWGTMQSTATGHPGAPLDFSPWPAVLDELLYANFGIDFELDGLRARVEIDRKPMRR